MSRCLSCIHYSEGNRCNLFRGQITEWDEEHCSKFCYNPGDSSELVLQQIPVLRD